MFKKQFFSHGLFGILAALLLVASACSKDNDSSPTVEDITTVKLEFNGLEPLENGFNYQAWVVSGNYGYPLGIFNFNGDGEMVDVSGDTLLDGLFITNLGLEEITGVGVTIEYMDVITTIPSYTHILGGEVVEGHAALTVGDDLSMGISFDGATGKYILATPTDSIDTNENSGIWFLDLTTGISLNGFNLPEPPSGWDYEGWVILDGAYISTGKFSRFTAADDSAYYSGSLQGPPFPGEDFLDNAPEGLSFPLDLAGASVMITLEPWEENDDNRAEPFFIKVLAAEIPTDAADHINYYMNAATDPLPTGTATLQ